MPFRSCNGEILACKNFLFNFFHLKFFIMLSTAKINKVKKLCTSIFFITVKCTAKKAQQGKVPKVCCSIVIHVLHSNVISQLYLSPHLQKWTLPVCSQSMRQSTFSKGSSHSPLPSPSMLYIPSWRYSICHGRIEPNVEEDSVRRETTLVHRLHEVYGGTKPSPFTTPCSEQGDKVTKRHDQVRERGKGSLAHFTVHHPDADLWNTSNTVPLLTDTSSSCKAV